MVHARAHASASRGSRTLCCEPGFFQKRQRCQKPPQALPRLDARVDLAIRLSRAHWLEMPLSSGQNACCLSEGQGAIPTPLPRAPLVRLPRARAVDVQMHLGRMLG